MCIFIKGIIPHPQSRLAGARFGRLFVVPVGNELQADGSEPDLLRCNCLCGKWVNVTAAELAFGLKSCGCIDRVQPNQ